MAGRARRAEDCAARARAAAASCTIFSCHINFLPLHFPLLSRPSRRMAPILLNPGQGGTVRQSFDVVKEYDAECLDSP
jgi:hypothetical protein